MQLYKGDTDKGNNLKFFGSSSFDLMRKGKEGILRFIVSSIDGKWLYTGGEEKILYVIDRHKNTVHLKVNLAD